ncbi:hypothetical protein BDV06DRAFT_235848 [Aspergillus oleicola]
MMMFIIRALRILKDALFASSLSLKTRCLMLTLQPITLLTYAIEYLTSLKFPHSHEIRISLRNGERVRAVVYIPPTSQAQTQPQDPNGRKRVPLHLNIHGGAFLGGLPEANARFCHSLAQSGVLVVSSAYRYAPKHTFPVAHGDVCDVAVYLLGHAEELWGGEFEVDVEAFTVSGFSVGGNLALGIAQQLRNNDGEGDGKKNMDFRLPPQLKPKPEGFPKYDPLSFLMPLFDAYAGPNRIGDIDNPLLHPTLANIRTLPRNMSFVVGRNDILLAETGEFVARLEADAERINGQRGLPGKEVDGRSIIVKSFVAEGMIHGWTEMPSFAINVEMRTKAFNKAIAFLRDVHGVYSSDA